MTEAYLIDGSKIKLHMKYEDIISHLHLHPEAKYIQFNDFLLFLDKVIHLTKLEEK